MVEAALRSAGARPLEVLVAQGESPGRLARLKLAADRAGVPVREVPRGLLDRLTGDGRHQGAAARLASWPLLDEEDLAGRLPAMGRGAFLLVLDHVQDVGNFGAVIRSANLAGVHGVVVPRDRSAPMSPAVVRASAGAALLTDIYRVGNLHALLGRLKKAGLWIFGLDASGTESLPEADLTVPLALVLGGEHQGLSRLVRETCDRLVRIPMAGGVGSYNASVAAALAMYEVMRQRGSGREGGGGGGGVAPPEGAA